MVSANRVVLFVVISIVITTTIPSPFISLSLLLTFITKYFSLHCITYYHDWNFRLFSFALSIMVALVEYNSGGSGGGSGVVVSIAMVVVR
jgi:hypothetical protein